MKIVILDAYAANPGDLSWDEFAALGELTVYDRTAQEDAAARIGDAEVVFINKVRLTDEIFAACPNLKLVSILATGYNIVDLAAAKRRGITVCNVPGYSTRAVVQMTFACCWRSASRSACTPGPCTRAGGRPARISASGTGRSSSWTARPWASSATVPSARPSARSRRPSA